LAHSSFFLHQHGADEPDDGAAVVEDADHAGAAAQFLVEALLGAG
jgi:hypothetical protein